MSTRGWRHDFARSDSARARCDPVVVSTDTHRYISLLRCRSKLFRIVRLQPLAIMPQLFRARLNQFRRTYRTLGRNRCMAVELEKNLGGAAGTRVALTALLVLFGCYLGARAGTAVVFPGVGTAVLFPPYAVLTAALILTPPRQWWLYLFASAAGNFWPHLQHEGLSSFVLQAEAANITR